MTVTNEARAGQLNQPVPEGHLPVTQVVDALHASYRQVDHWIRQGWVDVEGRDCGSGNHRTIDPRALVVLRVMDELVHVGIAPSKAGRIAAQLVADPSSEHLEGAIRLAVHWEAIAA